MPTPLSTFHRIGDHLFQPAHRTQLRQPGHPPRDHLRRGHGWLTSGFRLARRARRNRPGFIQAGRGDSNLMLPSGAISMSVSWVFTSCSVGAFSQT